MQNSTKWMLGIGGVFVLFWVDANVLSIGLDRINPLTPSEKERQARAATLAAQLQALQAASKP